MERTWWLVATALLAATGARAEEKTRFFIAPSVGYTHLRIDEGRIPDQLGTLKTDAFQLGFSLGFQMPVGFLLEIGHSDAVHTDIFFGDQDIDLASNYGAVGWRIPFGDGWHFTPKIGRGKWKLTSSEFEWFDDDPAIEHEIDGWDNFWEVSLSRELNKVISLGVHFKDVDQDFGHSRSGTFVATFAF